MPIPEGYLAKNEVFLYIHDKLGFGRRVVENMMTELERSGNIHFVTHPAHRGAKLLTKADVEKLVAALTLAPGNEQPPVG